jgi:N-acetylmuramoyl-L-alanine amidase
MNRVDTLIVLGTAHRLREPGKQSPDGRLKECVWSRQICKEIATKLRSYGYKVEIDYEPLDLDRSMWSANVTTERNRELAMRVNYVNELCRQNGAKNVLYVSIHVNAAGADNKWHDANGWQVCVSTKASASSKLLANCLFERASKAGLKCRKPQAFQNYWPQSLYVLNSTNCPAVLTENLFQDNKKDVDYLLSGPGIHNIVRLHIEGIIDYIDHI